MFTPMGATTPVWHTKDGNILPNGSAINRWASLARTKKALLFKRPKNGKKQL
jgi:hypothetical protein